MRFHIVVVVVDFQSSMFVVIIEVLRSPRHWWRLRALANRIQPAPSTQEGLLFANLEPEALRTKQDLCSVMSWVSLFLKDILNRFIATSHFVSSFTRVWIYRLCFDTVSHLSPVIMMPTCTLRNQSLIIKHHPHALIGIFS